MKFSKSTQNAQYNFVNQGTKTELRAPSDSGEPGCLCYPDRTEPGVTCSGQLMVKGGGFPDEIHLVGHNES